MSTERDAKKPRSGVKGAVRKAVQGAQAAVSSPGTSTDERPAGAPAAKKAPKISTSTPSETSVPTPPPAKKAPASIPPSGAVKAPPAKKAVKKVGSKSQPAPSADSPAPAAPSAPAPAPGQAERPAPRAVPAASAAAVGAPRRVRLALSRVDPWSVMKLSFLLSVAIGIMIVVATVAAWTMIDSLGVFASVDQLIREVLGAESADKLNIMQYFTFERFVSGATLVGVVDVVLLTALSTIGAFLYNITAALVGGLHVTLTDE